MRIAVACDGLAIAAHFIQCTSYMCYTVEDDLVVNSQNVPAQDQPLEMLPEFFQAIKASVLVAGAIEQELIALLESHGIRVFSGETGDPLSAVRELLAQGVNTEANATELAYN